MKQGYRGAMRLTLAVLLLTGGIGSARADTVTYRGFTIDTGAVPADAVATDLAGAESQIDQMDDDHLSPALMRFFRSLPIRLQDRPGGEGVFHGEVRAVEINRVEAGDDRPVLLHEYLHAFEWFTMPDGFRNADIHRFYDEARAEGLYPAGSYMMKNAAEFLAVTASCYLHGTVARPPYDRASIRAAQPDYYGWLQRLLGPVGG